MTYKVFGGTLSLTQSINRVRTTRVWGDNQGQRPIVGRIRGSEGSERPPRGVRAGSSMRLVRLMYEGPAVTFMPQGPEGP